MSETPLIYQAIVKVMEEVSCVGKNQKNKQQGFMFRGIDAVMNAIHPALVRNKVFIVPEVLEQEREERQTKSGTSMIYSICKMRYTFYAADGSSITAVVIGEGMDTGDKATNKAMAIAFKYACFQVFCIPTEEMKDPDSETPEASAKKDSIVAPSVPEPETPRENTKKGSVPVPNVPEPDSNTLRNRVHKLEQTLKKNRIKPQTIHVLYRVNSLEELSEAKYQNIMKHLEDIKKRQKTHELEQILKKNEIPLQMIYQLYQVKSLEELSDAKYNNILEHIEDIKNRQNTVT